MSARSSSHHDSMDEGLIVRFVNDGKKSESDINDIDEHPSKEPPAQKHEFVNKFGLKAEIVSSSDNMETL